jgi:hypothetical protein
LGFQPLDFGGHILAIKRALERKASKVGINRIRFSASAFGKDAENVFFLTEN